MKLPLLMLGFVAFALPTPSFASPSWEDVSTATALAAADHAPLTPAGFAGRAIATPALVGEAAATTPAFFANFVTSTQTQSGIPCFSCVNGTTSDTFGIDLPYNVVAAGAEQTFLISWTDVTFKGTCKIAISAASGKTVIESFANSFKDLTPGAFDAWFFSGSVSYVGPAMLVGKVTCGTKTSSSKAPLVFR